MPRYYKPELERYLNLKSGAAAGVIAGLVMALSLMIYSAAVGQGAWAPVAAVGATFYGPNAMFGGFAPILTGVFIHLAVSAALGAFFAYSLPRASGTGGAVSLGICYGVGVWAVMSFLVAPLADPSLASVIPEIPGFWFFSHLLFGASLGSVPRLRRVFSTSYLDPRSSDYLDRAA